MFEFFETVGNIISGLIDFIMMLIDGLITIFEFIPKALEMLNGVAESIPPFVVPFVMTFIAISLVLFILGRNNA